MNAMERAVTPGYLLRFTIPPTVSYTHLDVYKRQGHRFNASCAAACPAFSIICR